MAIITPTSAYSYKNTRFGKNLLSTWVMNLDDIGIGSLFSTFPDKSVHVSGTFGGAVVRIEGSNNSTDGQNGNWVLLRDPFNNTLLFNAAELKQILENTKFVRAVVTGGDGTTVLTVAIYGSSNIDD